MEGQEKIAQILKNTEDRMKKTLESAKKEFAKVRTGRASIHLLDDIRVEVYDSVLPLNQVSTITTPESNLILVQVWDKNIISAVEKAIRSSGLGFNPVVEGTVIKIPVPPLTEERRKELVKFIKKHAEDFRIAIRNIRRDANEEIKKLEKNKEISEDDMHRALDKVQELTKKYTEEIDSLLEKKEQEIMAI